MALLSCMGDTCFVAGRVTRYAKKSSRTLSQVMFRAVPLSYQQHVKSRTKQRNSAQEENLFKVAHCDITMSNHHLKGVDATLAQLLSNTARLRVHDCPA